MNCPVFVAFKAEREAKEAAPKAATKAADQRAYRKTSTGSTASVVEWIPVANGPPSSRKPDVGKSKWN